MLLPGIVPFPMDEALLPVKGGVRVPPAPDEAMADDVEAPVALVAVPEAAGRLVLAPEGAALEPEPEAEPEAAVSTTEELSPAGAPSAGVVAATAPSAGAVASPPSAPPGALVVTTASPSAGEL